MPFSVAVAAFFPVFGLLTIGWLVRRRQWLPEGFWRAAESLTYFLLMPALIIGSLSRVDPAELPLGAMALCVVAPLLLGFATLAALRPALRMSGPAFTSVLQGGIRFNTYIALALVVPLFGETGLAFAGVALGVMIIAVNVLSVSAFALFAPQPGAPLSTRTVIRQILRNPLVLACLLGGLIAATLPGLPIGVAGLVESLGAAALPIGVMSVGAALAAGSALPPMKPFLAASLVKFGLMPGAALLTCLTLGLSGLAAAVVLILFATPTAPSGYILSRQLGGDHELMAALINAQTLAACLYLPLALPLLLAPFV